MGSRMSMDDGGGAGAQRVHAHHKVEITLDNAIGAHLLRCFKPRMELPCRGLKCLASAHHVRFQTHLLGETTVVAKT